MTPLEEARDRAKRGLLLRAEDFEAIRVASTLPPKDCPCPFFQAGKMGVFTGSGECGSDGKPNKIPTGEFEAECEHFAHGVVTTIVTKLHFCPRRTEVKFIRLAP